MRLSRSELIRKTLHISAALIPLICLRLTKWESVTFWSLLLLVAFVVEYWRRRKETKLSVLFYRSFGPLLRPKEKKKLAGVTYLFVSGLLSYLIFPKGIATLALLYLTIGDGLATIVGLGIGRHFWSEKSLEGTLAFIISSFLISLVVPGVALWVKGAGAILAGVLEALKLPESDNLWIPLVSGFFMWVLSTVHL